MASRYPTPSQRRTLWSALTGMAIVVLAGLVVGSFYLLGTVLNYLQPVLVPLAVAGILAYLIHPAVAKLEQKGATRLRAIIYIFTFAAVLIAFAGTLAVPPLVRETTNLLENRENIGTNLLAKIETTDWAKPFIGYMKERHPDYAKDPPAADPPAADPPAADPPAADPPAADPPANPTADPDEPDRTAGEQPNVPFKETRAGVWLEKATAEILDLSALMTGAGRVFGFIGYALGFLLVPVYLFFFLMETGSIKRRWSDFVPLKESKFKTEVVETLSEMNGYLIAFFRGQVLVSIIDGVLTGLLLWLIGLPHAMVIGIALAVLGIMPFIGFLVTLIPALIIAAAEWGDWQHPLLVFGIFFAVQQLDGLVIQPKIIGDKVGLHPMTIIFSIFFWSLLLGGFLGALLAVPLTASVKVILRRYVWDRAVLEKRKPPPAAAPSSSGPAPAG